MGLNDPVEPFPAEKPKIAIIDFEATCDRDRSAIAYDEMEIIEIGCVLINHELEVLQEYTRFVRPVNNPRLTDFCTELTTITQGDVDAAPMLPEVFTDFVDRMVDDDTSFASWGDFDRKLLERQCREHDLTYPFSDHINVKQWVADQTGWKPTRIDKVLEKLGKDFSGTFHRGIDDVRNIVTILREITGTSEKQVSQ